MQKLKETTSQVIALAGIQICISKIHRVRKRLYPFLFFFLGAQCVESGVSFTDCY